MSHPQPPFPPQPPTAQPPKKRKKWPFVVAAVVALFVVIAIANGGKNTGTDTAQTTAPAAPAEQPAVAPVEQPKPKTRVVLYEVLGTGTATNITYTTDGMTSSEQVGDAPLPWSKTIELPAGEALQMVSVLAQAGADTLEISARITVDGKVVKEGKSSGQFAVVTVNDNIGSLGN